MCEGEKECVRERKRVREGARMTERKTEMKMKI